MAAYSPLGYYILYPWEFHGGNSSGNSSSSDVPSSDNYNPNPGTDGEVSTNDVMDYLNGLFTNQGLENMLNRQFNSAEAAMNRQFQHKEAALQRDWYEAMSNSAYQRAVADMKKAGINPILAYQQGGAASAGTGVAAGSAASYTATGGDTLSSILSSVADLVSSITSATNGKMSNILKYLKWFS